MGNQMTKEPIMIDDIDVSGCDFLAKEDDYCSYSGEYRAYKGQCGCSDEEFCKDHPNCFYKKALKQLKNKEQECKKLLEFNNSLVEEHKTIGNDLYKEIKEYRKKLQAKEQECEYAQRQVDYFKDLYSQENDNKVALKQALQEIKEIITNSFDSCYVCNSKDSCEKCLQGEILQKCEVINE